MQPFILKLFGEDDVGLKYKVVMFLILEIHRKIVKNLLCDKFKKGRIK